MGLDSHPARSFDRAPPNVKQLLSETQIRDGIRRMAAEIARHYQGSPLTIVGVLTGSMVLVADLIRHLDLPVRVGVVQARSYRGAATVHGPLSVDDSMLPEIKDRDVLIVDDIFDTGHTLGALVERFHELGARSVRSAVLLRKQGRAEVDFLPDHVGFDIPNAFVVGYGLDYQDAYRHLPFVAVLEDDDLAAGPPP
jgi:hypoxanthine phosphoribosyltransferase